MNRQIDHPIKAQIATLSTMARIHGIGDENRIARPELARATGCSSDGASTSCGYFMQPLANSRESEEYAQSRFNRGKMTT
jgi:hypothetical protein